MEVQNLAVSIVHARPSLKRYAREVEGEAMGVPRCLPQMGKLGKSGEGRNLSPPVVTFAGAACWRCLADELSML